MKRLKLIATIATFVSLPAMADSWAIPNKAGGEIVINDKLCPGYKHIMQAYLYVPGGRSMTGCWMLQDGMVRVVWQDNTEYVYPANDFYKKSTDKKGQGI